MKIKLLLTFDHELPLGGLNTSYDKALFEPTRQVLDMADKYGVKITLFSDIFCACRYEEWDRDGFYIPYCNQIRNALGRGHDVQLHIHPHWLTTQYDGTRFIPSDDFALSDFKNKPCFGGIFGIIKRSIDKMNEICGAEDADYKCIAFRAGGYNIYPETKTIFESLYDNGIRYDCSMAKGYYFKSGISEVDFHNTPAPCNWLVNPDNYRTSLSHGAGILEIPIATIPKTLFEIPTRFKLKKYACRAVENRGVAIHPDDKTNWFSEIKMLFAARMLSFDNYTLSPDYLLKIFKYNIRKYEQIQNEIMFCAIAHPKSMGDYSLRLMEGFIRSILRDYPDTEFTTCSRLSSE